MQTTGTHLQNQRIETIFYLTLLVSIVQFGFILWDMFTLIPGVGALVGLRAPNAITSSGLMSLLYLALLGIYAGYKEFVRWTSSEQEIPEEQVIRFKRGEFIVSFWIVLTVIALTIWQMRIIARMPNELFRTALQALGVMFGTYASKGLYKESSKKKAEDRTLVNDNQSKVIEYIKANGSIDNETCQKVFNLDRGRAYRLLERLEKQGLIKSEGTGKASKYTLKS
ncbi:MAG: hypothetical protein NT145_04805 [Elusimicrobia bacterium]|nr:hypothetical protein [Elusimicrobiota bacterium]